MCVCVEMNVYLMLVDASVFVYQYFCIVRPFVMSLETLTSCVCVFLSVHTSVLMQLVCVHGALHHLFMS